MPVYFSGQQHDPALLRTLCGSDPSLWCFVPLGGRCITWCSQAFLELWGLLPDDDSLRGLPSAFNNSALSIDSDVFRKSLERYGLTNVFLSQITDGSIGADHPPTLIVRNDGRNFVVTWSPVLDSTGLPFGRLIRFRSDLPGDVTERVMATVAGARLRLAILTERERQVLDHLFEGKTNKAIAIGTHLSEKTVEKHRSKIMHKLKLNSTTELVKLVARARMIDECKMANSENGHY